MNRTPHFVFSGIGFGLRGLIAYLIWWEFAHAQLANLLVPVETNSSSSLTTATDRKAPEELFTQADLLRELGQALSEHFSLTGDLELEVTRPWASITVSARPMLSVLEYPRQGMASQMTVRCRLTINDNELGEWFLPLQARLWEEVWVSASTLRNGQALEPSLLRTQRVDLLRYRSQLLEADRDPTNYQMVQSLGAGAVLTMRDLIEKPLIQKNQMVDAILQRGSLSITMKAQALENGSPRAFIKMRNLESRKEFSAQVINERQVHVFF